MRGSRFIPGTLADMATDVIQWQKMHTEWIPGAPFVLMFTVE